MATAVIALGSNLGDRLGQLRTAVQKMGQLGTVTAVSRLYETDPVGGPDQDRYLNAVVVVETELDPTELLAALHRIEGDSERVREVRWGPRTLDLDIVAYDDQTIMLPGLEIPHPRAHERHFVLAPLIDVRPDTVLANGMQARDAISQVSDQYVESRGAEWAVASPALGSGAWWVAGQVVAFAAWLGAVVLGPRAVVPWAMVMAGAVVAFVGLGQAVAAVRAFGRDITPSPRPRAGAKLVAHGIYRRVRHPMYGAILLTFLGVAMAAGSWSGIAMTGVVALFFRAKSELEERMLTIVLPGYAGYREQVKRRFIPFVW